MKLSQEKNFCQVDVPIIPLYHYTNYTTWDEKVLIEFNIFTFILGECILLQLSSYILKPGVPCEFNYSANYFLSKSICNFRVGAYILQLIALYLFTFSIAIPSTAIPSIAIWGIAANKGWSGEVSQDDEQRQSELVWILGHSTWQCSYCATGQWNDVKQMERVLKTYLICIAPLYIFLWPSPDHCQGLLINPVPEGL